MLTKQALEDIAQKCLDLIAARQLETDKAKLKLEGAAEGVKFLLNSLTETMETEDGKGNKPVSPLTKV